MRRNLRLALATMVALILVTSLVLSLACANKAQTGTTAKEFYQGNTIMISTGSAGGNADLIVRAMAPLLEKETGATVVVQNQPGGSTFQNINLVWQAKPDGLSLYFGDMVAWALGDWMDEPGVLWDTAKFNWLVRLGYEPTIYVENPKDPINSLQELQQAKGLKYGTSTPTSWNGLADMSLASLLNLDAKVITGFAGTGGLVLSIQKGELAGAILTETLANQFVKSGQLKAVFVYCGQSTTFSSLPQLQKAVKPTKDQQMVLDFLPSPASAIATGPDVSKDRVDFLRGVVTKICQDSTTRQAIVKAANMSAWYGFVPGEEVQQTMGQKEFGPEISRIIKALQQKYLIK